jgi:Ca2+-binding RTX toxin-like protein
MRRLRCLRAGVPELRHRRKLRIRQQNPPTIVTISGVSAADTTVAVTTDTAIAAGGGTITRGRFTGSLDGTFVQFADGSVLKTSTASAVLVGSIGGDDQLIGSSANDTLRGLGGNDTLTGGAGIELLRGDSCNNTCIGGQGTDLLFADQSY